jgi:hypothetical protein
MCRFFVSTQYYRMYSATFADSRYDAPPEQFKIRVS